MTTTLDSGALSESTGLRFAAACGVMGSTGFIVLWLAAGLWERRYNTARQDISDFGALTATHPDIYNTGVCVVGVLLVVLAIGVIAAGGRSRAWNAGSFALLSFGACQFLDGVFREDCSPSGDPACRRALDAGALSWHHSAHDIESVVWFASMVAAMILLALAFRARPRWRSLALPSAGLAIVAAAAIIWYLWLYVAHDGSAYGGVLERISTAAGFTWTGAVAVRLWSVAGPPDAETSRSRTPG